MLGPILVLCSALAAPSIQVKTGAAVTFDGKVETAEWSDAYVLPATYPDGEKFELRLKRQGAWLAIGLTGGRAYAGDSVRLQVADEYGSWITDLYLTVAQPAMPPALWRRGPPLVLAKQKLGVSSDCPRGVRLRVDVARPDAWSAEYLVRLSTLGIGHRDQRKFRARVTVQWSAPVPGLLTSYPAKGSGLDVSSFAPFESADGWGADESWEPIATAISREFDDHELLLRLFREYARFAKPEETSELVISFATRPRMLAKINALKAALDAGAKRNPTLPAWDCYRGWLLHEANLHAETQAIVDRIPDHLARLEPFVILFAEHYLDMGRWKEAFMVCDANQRTPGVLKRVKFILNAARKSKEERAAIEKDDAKPEPNPRVRLVVRDKGAVVIELFEDDAKMAVLNFMDLVINQKYFDGMKFHSVIGGSHVAVGDPRSRPGSKVKEDGPAWRLRPDDSPRHMMRGYVATVPAGPGAAQHGSQFIISVVPMLEQARQRTVFGRVVEGLEILESLEQDDSLERVEIVRKRNHTYDSLPARFR